MAKERHDTSGRYFMINPPKPAPSTPFFWMDASREDFTTKCALEFRLQLLCDDVSDAECEEYFRGLERKSRILGGR